MLPLDETSSTLDGPQPNLGEYAFYAFDKIQTEKKLAQISGKKIRIVRMSVATIEKQGIPLPFSIDQHQIYSGTRLYRKFGFQSTPLVQGMEKTCGFYKSNLKKKEL